MTGDLARLSATSAPAGVEAKWRERWYGSEPEKGSAITDERGNLVAYFGGDEATHAAVTKIVAQHNAALSAAPAPSGQEVADASREVMEAFANILDAVPSETASAAHFSFDTTHGHACVLRRAVRELLDRAATVPRPYKPFWENPDGPGAA